MDTGTFGPTYQSSSEEDSEELSDAHSGHESTGILENRKFKMTDVESSSDDDQVARDISLPEPSPADSVEINMPDADLAPEPHQEKSVEPVSQENAIAHTTTTQEKGEEMLASPSPPSPPQLSSSPSPSPPPALIIRDTSASMASESIEEHQPPSLEPKSIEETHSPAPVSNEAILPLTPQSSPSSPAKSARIQTLLSSLALLNEESKAFFFARLDVLYAKIEAL